MIPTEEQIKEVKRKLKDEHSQLKDLSRACFIFLRRLDEVMKEARVDKAIGKTIACLANRLEMENDKARYFNLGVNFRKDNKDKEWQEMKAQSIK